MYSAIIALPCSGYPAPQRRVRGRGTDVAARRSVQLLWRGTDDTCSPQRTVRGRGTGVTARRSVQLFDGWSCVAHDDNVALVSGRSGPQGVA